MELDDFKNIGNEEIISNTEPTELKPKNMESFIEELKTKDASERKKTLIFIPIFFVFIGVYSASITLYKGGMRTGYALLILGFSLILVYIFWRFRRLKDINYSAPTTIFLRDAERRHMFMTTLDWLITIPLLALLVTGGSFIVYFSFLRYFPGTYVPLLIYLCIMACAIGVGFWASHKDWVKNKGWILTRIRQMKEELGI